MLSQLLQDLTAAGVDVSVEAGRLVVTGPLDDALRDALRHCKPALLELLAPVAEAPVSLRNLAPTSREQARLWFLHRVAANRSQYNVISAWRICGALDRRALQAALDAQLRRHDSLRTVFLEDAEGESWQLVTEASALTLQVHELPGAMPEQEDRLAALLSRFRTHAFDLGREIPIRADLIALSTEDNVLVLNVHHIATDGHSMQQFYRELSETYADIVARGSSGDLSPTYRYIDYARHQQEMDRAGHHAQSLAYWRETLSGCPDYSGLVREHGPVQGRGARSGKLHATMPVALSTAVRETCRRLGMTPLMVFESALALLLSIHSRADDVVVAMPVSQRERPEFADVVGLFVNTVAIRTRPDFERSVEAHLIATRDTISEAVRHASVPFDHVVESLKLTRSAGPLALAQTMIVYQRGGALALDIPGARVEAVPMESAASKFDLTLVITEVDDLHELRWEFDDAVLGRAVAERAAQSYLRLLDGLLAAPGRALSELSLQSEEAGREQVLAWNRRDPAYFAFDTALQAFEHQARRSPARRALFDDVGSWTYGELDAMAEGLARTLRSVGVRAGQRVGLFLERSPANVLAMLATLKCRCAYVPLDPANPAERLQHIGTDADLACCIGSAERPVWLAASAAHLRLPVDPHETGWPTADVHAQSAGAPEAGEAEAEAEAYLVYTSGSTGRPKGVVLRHRGLVNLIANMSAQLQAGPGSVVAQFATPGFDAATWEYFMALGTGAALYVPPEEARRDPALLSEHCRRAGVTHITLPPSLLTHLEPRRLGVTHVVAVGEACDPKEARRWGQSSVRFFNGYGPSEATCATTLGEYDGEGVFTIGRPLVNVSVTIRDPHGHLLPPGVPGEIHVSGECLARSYLNQPDATERAFKMLPLGGDGSVGTCYATGDLGRWLENGEIEYLGRTSGDGASASQVKIRGYRIELAEVEAALCDLTGLVRAVVLLDRQPDVEPALAAFVLGQAGHGLTRETVRTALSARLPQYMIPARIEFIDSMPLTVNGKVDRAALMASLVRPTATLGPESPGKDLRDRIAVLWQELLECDAIGREANFFELGGHSLLAIRLMSLMHDRIGVELPATTIFHSPSFADFCAAVSSALGEAEAMPTVTGEPALPTFRIPQVERGPGLVISQAQRRLWFFAQLPDQASIYNVPTVWRLYGSLHREHLQQALDQLIARHEALRTAFVARDGEVSQQILPARTPCPIDFAPLDTHDEGALSAWVEWASIQPFDLSTAPLMRVHVRSLGAQEHVLLLNIHHIVCDGVSIALMLDEFSHLYNRLQAGLPPDLPELPVQYADYAAWQHRRIQDGEVSAHLDFWRKALAQAPALLTLPNTLPTPPMLPHRAGRLEVSINAATAAGIRALAKSARCTPFLVWLAGWSLLLSRWANQEEVVVGVPVSNRDAEDIQRVVGFFINTLPVRLCPDLCERVEDMVLAAQAAWTDCLAHQDTPFEQIVEALQPPRVAGRNPVFQAMLNFATGGRAEPSFSGLVTERMPAREIAAHFDVSLSVREMSDGFDVVLLYATDRFSQRDACDLASSLSHVMRQLAEGGDTSLATIELLDERGRSEVIGTFGNVQPIPDVDPGESVYALFYRQVVMRGQAPAVRHDGKTLSYAELHARSTALAEVLVRRGVGREDLVALRLGRGLDMFVAILAVLRIGAAYVPLDPELPEARARAILSDCSARLMLSDQTSPMDLAGVDVEFVDLRHVDWAAPPSGLVSDKPTAQDRHLPGAANAACVLYTSGSTGQPKGVIVEHGSLLNFWRALLSRHGASLRAGSRFGHNANYTFDASLQGIVLLMSGIELRPIPQQVRLDAAAFIQFLRDEAIEAFDCTPPQMEYLVGGGLLERLDQLPLRIVLIGGAAIDQRLWSRLADAASVEFINVYGPTECTIDATMERIDGAVAPHIGVPLDNVSVYVLDRFRHPVPVGVIGEIYIGGLAVTRGYLNRPALNADRFLSDPWTDRAGGRMFKTGDLARWRADGRLEYCGRNDFQVKVRGFRIELEDIEAALRQLPQVRDCVVLAIPRLDGDLRLVAYVVAHAGHRLEGRALRAELDRQLPSYMVPSDYVSLSALPLTSNGKVDRSALPQALAEVAGPQDFEAPEGQVEEAVAKIWAELTQTAGVGRRHNFFEIGGHSLMAVRMISAIEQTLGVNVPLRELFAHPVLEPFAARIRQLASGSSTSQLMSLRRSGTRRPLFFIHPGEGEVGYAMELAKAIDVAVPIHGIAASGFHPGEVALRSIAEMAASYTVLIRSIQPDGPYRLVGWSAGGTIAFEIAQHLVASGEAVEFLAMLDTALDYSAVREAGYRSGEDGGEVQALRRLLRLPSGDGEPAMTAEQLYQSAQVAGVLPPDIDVPQLRRHLAVRDGIRAALAEYVPTAPSFPVEVFVANEDPSDRNLGREWRERWIGSAAVSVHAVPGTHRSMVAAPNGARLGALLDARLRQLDSDTDTPLLQVLEQET